MTFGYEGMSKLELQSEAQRLVAERRRIIDLLWVHKQSEEGAIADAKVGSAETAGGLLVTLGGAAGGFAGNPLAIAAFFGGIFLTYRSGRKAWSSAALADEIADEISQLNDELVNLEKRRDAVWEMLRR